MWILFFVLIFFVYGIVCLFCIRGGWYFVSFGVILVCIEALSGSCVVSHGWEVVGAELTAAMLHCVGTACFGSRWYTCGCCF